VPPLPGKHHARESIFVVPVESSGSGGSDFSERVTVIVVRIGFASFRGRLRFLCSPYEAKQRYDSFFLGVLC
jgi:hypothetical protein